MRNGTIEGAALTLDETLILLEDGFDLRVILILDYSNGADAILGQPNLSTLKDLKGKRVAVEYTAVGAIMLGTALQLAGLTTEDIEIIHSPLDEHKKTFADVDAIVTFEPLRTQILNDGAKLLFDSSQIPERIIDVVVVFEKTMRTHPKALRNLVQGYFKARKYMTENPEAAFVRLAPRLGLTVDQVKTAYEGITLTELSGNEALLKGSEPKLNSIAEDLATFMFEQNLLHRNVNTDFLGEGKFLRNE
jgi:NitT/TauT family transport system substrate-binding protein